MINLWNEIFLFKVLYISPKPFILRLNITHHQAEAYHTDYTVISIKDASNAVCCVWRNVDVHWVQNICDIFLKLHGKYNTQLKMLNGYN